MINGLLSFKMKTAVYIYYQINTILLCFAVYSLHLPLTLFPITMPTYSYTLTHTHTQLLTYVILIFYYRKIVDMLRIRSSIHFVTVTTLITNDTLVIVIIITINIIMMMITVTKKKCIKMRVISVSD